jgi:hypothetical protein
VHLTISPRSRLFGDAPRPGVLRQNGRDRIRPPQYVARIVANALRRFGRKTLAARRRGRRCSPARIRRSARPQPARPPDRTSLCDARVRMSRLRQRGPLSRSARSRLRLPSAEPRDSRARAAHSLRVCVPQKCGRFSGRARPASGIKIPRDFGECVNASEERQIVRNHPAQHEASRFQPVCVVRQGHLRDASAAPDRQYTICRADPPASKCGARIFGFEAPLRKVSSGRRLTYTTGYGEITAVQRALRHPRPTSIGTAGRLRFGTGGRHQSEWPADIVGIRTSQRPATRRSRVARSTWHAMNWKAWR